MPYCFNDDKSKYELEVFKTEMFELTENIPANEAYGFYFDNIEMQGYTPIAIQAIGLADVNSFAITRYDLNELTATVYVRNLTNAAKRNCNVWITVLYVTNDMVA